MENLTEAVGLFDSEPHTDLTDPTGFLCGWKISRRLVGLFDSEPHTDLTHRTGFSLWVENLTEACGFLCEGKSHGFL